MCHQLWDVECVLMYGNITNSWENFVEASVRVTVKNVGITCIIEIEAQDIDILRIFSLNFFPFTDYALIF